MIYTAAIILVIAALWLARSAYRACLLARRKIRAEEASNAKQRRMLEAAMSATVQEAARMAILHDMSGCRQKRN